MILWKSNLDLFHTLGIVVAIKVQNTDSGIFSELPSIIYKYSQHPVFHFFEARAADIYL